MWDGDNGDEVPRHAVSIKKYREGGEIANWPDYLWDGQNRRRANGN